MKDGKPVAYGDTLRFTALRNDSGIYLCLADNGLNVTVKARTHLYVQCEYLFDSQRVGILNQVFFLLQMNLRDRLFFVPELVGMGVVVFWLSHSKIRLFPHRALMYSIYLLNQYQYLGNCPPTPPLTQH